MKTFRRVLAAVLAVAAPGAAFAADKAALVEHIRESYHIPAEVNVVLSDPKPSEVPGFDVMDMKMSHGPQSQSEKLYLSNDGRHYILGGFRDLTTNPDQERIAKMNLRGSPVRGPAQAPVEIVNYTDFQCPYCQKGYEIMRKDIMKRYPTQVRWIYKSLPLTAIHPWAEPAAVAAECAKEQSPDKFWKLHDSLFEHQREVNVSNLDQKLQDFAKLAQVDPKPFLACYDAKKTLPDVRRDANEAESMGISGTPAFVVNGHLISGADFEALKQTIEEAMQGRHGKI